MSMTDISTDVRLSEIRVKYIQNIIQFSVIVVPY